MTLFRHIFDKLLQRWLGAVGVLLALTLITRSLRFIAEAAAGGIPANVVLPLAGLQSLQVLSFLMPASLLLAALLTLSRLHDDNELAGLLGCGVSPYALARPLLVFGLLGALAAAALALQISPWAARAYERQVKTARAAAQTMILRAGEVRRLARGSAVVYAADSASGGRLQQVFSWFSDARGEHVLVAGSGRWQAQAAQALQLTDGVQLLEARSGNVDLFRFDHARIGVDTTPGGPLNLRRRYLPTARLWGAADRAAQAELQRRLGLPLASLLMVAAALALAPQTPRSGTAPRMLAAVLGYVLYNNLLSASHGWTEKTRWPVALGQWWVHALLLAAVAAALYRRYGLPSCAGPRSLRPAASGRPR